MDSFLLIPIFLVPVIIVVELLKRRRRKKDAAADALRLEKYQADELRRKRDHQLNLGRQLYNWLGGIFVERNYDVFGVKMARIEDNGGNYSIFIHRNVEGFSEPLPILQLTIDLVNLHRKGCEGHIHYGSYGADVYFPMPDHARKHGLDHLVVREVALDLEPILKRRREEQATIVR